MRKLAKGPALAAAILLIFSLLGTVTTFINYTRMPHVLPLNYLTLGINFVTLALMVVVLFRRKADTFAAVVCFVQILGALVAVLNAFSSSHIFVSRLPSRGPLMYFIGFMVLALYNVLRIPVYVLMGLQGIRKEPRKSTLCVILPIVALVLYAVHYILTINYTFGAYIGKTIRLDRFFTYPPALIGQIIGSFLGSLIGCLPLIFAGMAFSKIQTGESKAAPAPQYQQYQQYQAPQYQAPQYQAPQYQEPQSQQPPCDQ